MPCSKKLQLFLEMSMASGLIGEALQSFLIGRE